MNGFNSSIAFFLPEIILTAGILAIIVEQIFIKRNFTIYIALLAMALAVIFTCAQTDILSQKLFSNLLVIDPFAVFFKILILVSSLFIIYFSYVSNEITIHADKSKEFLLFVLLTTLGGLLMVSSVNLLLIYISIEMVNICLYFMTSATNSTHASIKNITFGLISSGLMLFGISLLFGISGSLDLYRISTFLSVNTFNPDTLLIAVLLILTGLCYKIISIPSYFTLPGIYQKSPIPVSAILSTTVFIAGFGLIIRFFLTVFHNPLSTVQNPDIFNLIPAIKWNLILAIIGLLTLILSNLTAIVQNNLKRLMAFISAAQGGYILLGLSCANPKGLTSSIFYILINLFNILGLFFCIILITNRNREENINSVKGLFSSSPYLAISFIIFLLSSAGFPVTSGFTARLFILSAMLNNLPEWMIALGGANILIGVYYVLKILKTIFSKSLTPVQIINLKPEEIFVMSVLLIPSIFGGIFFSPLIKVAELSSEIFGLK